MKNLNEQKQETMFKEIHTDLLSLGKCDNCKIAMIWLKKGGSKLSETKCNCGNALSRTTFLSTLKLVIKGETNDYT
jgi:hypothetical protein